MKHALHAPLHQQRGLLTPAALQSFHWTPCVKGYSVMHKADDSSGTDQHKHCTLHYAMNRFRMEGGSVRRASTHVAARVMGLRSALCS